MTPFLSLVSTVFLIFSTIDKIEGNQMMTDLEKLVETIPIENFIGDTQLTQSVDPVNEKTTYSTSNKLNIYQRPFNDQNKSTIILNPENNPQESTIQMLKNVYVGLRQNPWNSSNYHVFHVYLRKILPQDDWSNVHKLESQSFVVEFDSWYHPNNNDVDFSSPKCSFNVFVPCQLNSDNLDKLQEKWTHYKTKLRRVKRDDLFKHFVVPFEIPSMEDFETSFSRLAPEVESDPIGSDVVRVGFDKQKLQAEIKKAVLSTLKAIAKSKGLPPPIIKLTLESDNSTNDNNSSDTEQVEGPIDDIKQSLARGVQYPPNYIGPNPLNPNFGGPNKLPINPPYFNGQYPYGVPLNPPSYNRPPNGALPLNQPYFGQNQIGQPVNQFQGQPINTQRLQNDQRFPNRLKNKQRALITIGLGGKGGGGNFVNRKKPQLNINKAAHVEQFDSLTHEAVCIGEG